MYYKLNWFNSQRMLSLFKRNFVTKNANSKKIKEAAIDFLIQRLFLKYLMKSSLIQSCGSWQSVHSILENAKLPKS